MANETIKKGGNSALTGLKSLATGLLNVFLSLFKRQDVEKDKIIATLGNEIEKLKQELNVTKLMLGEADAKLEKYERNDVPKPNVKEWLNYAQVSLILNMFFKNADIKIADNKYGLIPIDEARFFLYKDRVNENKYQPEVFDCDDFSRSLYYYWKDWNTLLAFGIAWSDTHAFNVMIDDEKKVWIIEPQNDLIYSLDQVKDRPEYQVKFILM